MRLLEDQMGRVGREKLRNPCGIFKTELPPQLTTACKAVVVHWNLG